MTDSQHSDLLACIYLVGACVTQDASAFLLSALCLIELARSIYYKSRERQAAKGANP